MPPYEITTISADGKCREQDIHKAQIGAGDAPSVINIIIDGNQLSGNTSSSLLGQAFEFLPESYQFKISHFEPLDDGTCLVRYEQLEKNTP